MGFNFETRELIPYRELWPNGLSGSLYYIKSLDVICVLTDKDAGDLTDINYIRKLFTHNAKRIIAKGIPAALFANRDILWGMSFDVRNFYDAYQNEMERTLPNYPGYIVPPIIDDWIYTITQITDYPWDTSTCFDIGARYMVARLIRELTNPYKPIDDVDVLNMNCWFSFRNGEQLRVLYCSRPEETAPPSATSLVLLWNDYNDKSLQNIQAEGFIAAIIKYAIYTYWQNVWENLDFTKIETLKLYKSMSFKKPVLREEPITALNLRLSNDYQMFFANYISYVIPKIRESLSLEPSIPLECWEGDNIYSYIYLAEQEAWEKFSQSDLYQHLSPFQRALLYGYYKRFLEYLPKHYPITKTTVFQQTQARSKDIPPIQLEITNNMQITRKTQPRKNNYGDVVVWLLEEKLEGRDYYAEAGNNRSEMCRNISEILGWDVDENSLRKAQNRQKK